MTFSDGVRRHRAFTLLDLLVTVAVIALLAALLLPALGRATERARQVACTDRLRQWVQGLQMYAHDNRDLIPRESFEVRGVTLNTWADVFHPQADDVWYNGVPLALGWIPASHFAPQVRRPEFYRRSQLFHCPSVRFPAQASMEAVAYFSLAMNSKLINYPQRSIPWSTIRRPDATVAFLESRLKNEAMADPAQATTDLGQPSAYASRFINRHQSRGNLSFIDGHAEAFNLRTVVRRGLAIAPQETVVWTPDPESDPNH